MTARRITKRISASYASGFDESRLWNGSTVLLLLPTSINARERNKELVKPSFDLKFNKL